MGQNIRSSIVFQCRYHMSIQLLYKKNKDIGYMTILTKNIDNKYG